MVKPYTLSKLIKTKMFSHKKILDFIDAIGHSMNLKEQESLINKYSKTLVNKYYKIYIMVTMPLYSHMVKQDQVNPVQ